MQQASVRTYRQKLMTAESKEKVERSSAEILDLTERELRCPYCSHLTLDTARRYPNRAGYGLNYNKKRFISRIVKD